MAENEFTVKVQIEDGSESLPRKELGFTLHDSIFNPFPDLNLIFPDVSGLALEYGSFMQGIKIKTIMGTLDKLLETRWRSVDRNTVKESGSAPRLAGILQISGIHESYFNSRENPKLSFINKTVSACFKELFPNEKKLDIEETKGNINTYAFEDPYAVVKDILLPSASNGKISPYVFFRDLEGTLHFCSLDKLLEQSEVAKMELKANFTERDDETSVVTGFLPFNEKGVKVYPFMHTTGKILKADQTFKIESKSIATDAKNKIPFIADKRIDHDVYFGRQFNPAVEYDKLNTGFFSSSMKFILDKALCIIPFNYKCIAGKTIKIEVNRISEDGNEQLSEYYSGTWLIEQSYHCWNGETKRPFTRLVLCRRSIKPIKNSILETKAFKD